MTFGSADAQFVDNGGQQHKSPVCQKMRNDMLAIRALDAQFHNTWNTSCAISKRFLALNSEMLSLNRNNPGVCTTDVTAHENAVRFLSNLVPQICGSSK
jgi:hypothetical protein